MNRTILLYAVLVMASFVRGESKSDATKFMRDTMDACYTCDTLVEEVFHQATWDFDREAKEVMKRRDSSGVITVNVPLRATVQRMLEPLTEQHRWKTWSAYTDVFQNRSKDTLRRVQKDFMAAFHHIKIQTGRSQLLQVKTDTCGPHCHLHGPRVPAYSNSECGNCLSVVRDFSIEWEKLRQQDKNAAWETLDSVCSSVDIRHPSAHVDEVQAMCEQLQEEQGSQMVKLVARKSPSPDMQSHDITSAPSHTFHIATGKLSRAICFTSAALCGEQEFRNEVGRLSDLAKDLFYLGMAAT